MNTKRPQAVRDGFKDYHQINVRFASRTEWLEGLKNSLTEEISLVLSKPNPDNISEAIDLLNAYAKALDIKTNSSVLGGFDLKCIIDVDDQAKIDVKENANKVKPKPMFKTNKIVELTPTFTRNSLPNETNNFDFEGQIIEKDVIMTKKRL